MYPNNKFVKDAVCFLLLNSSENVIWVFNLIICGFLDDNDGAKLQAAVGLARVFYNISCWSILVSFINSLSVFIPQAFGANKMHLLGAFSQRCCLLSFVLFIPLIAIQFTFSYLLPLFGQSGKIADLSITYLYYLTALTPYFLTFWKLQVFVMSFMVLDRINRWILQSEQGTSTILYKITFYSFFVNVGATLYFVFTLGYIGLIYGMLCGYLARLTMEFYYLEQLRLLNRVWKPVSFRVLVNLDGMLQILRTGGQIVFQNFLTWGIYEIIILIVSWSTNGDVTSTAIAAIYTEILEMMAVLWMGVGQASGTALGLALGERNRRKVSKTMKDTMYGTAKLACALNFLIVSVLYLFSDLFTSLHDVNDGLRFISWHFFLTSFIMAMFSHAQSCMYAIDKTNHLVFSGFVSFYIVSIGVTFLPISFNWIRSNLWITIIACSNIAIGYSCQTLYCHRFISKINWRKEFSHMGTRMKKAEHTLVSICTEEEKLQLMAG